MKGVFVASSFTCAFTFRLFPELSGSVLSSAGENPTFPDVVAS